MIIMQSNLNKKELDKKLNEISEDRISLNLAYLATHYANGKPKQPKKDKYTGHKIQEDFDRPKSIIADQIKGEWDAIKNYHAAASDLSEIDGSFDNVIDTLNSIADEEEVHVGELISALSEIDDNVEVNIDNGQQEYAEDNSEEQELTEAISTPLIEDIDKLIEDIYEQRKVGIAEGGEYDNRNLLFKEFRNKGYLDNLKTLKSKLISNELSLKETMELTNDYIKKLLNSNSEIRAGFIEADKEYKQRAAAKTIEPKNSKINNSNKKELKLSESGEDAQREIIEAHKNKHKPQTKISEVEELYDFHKKRIKLGLSDDVIEDVKNEIIKNPEAGDRIIGGNGARKIRVAINNNSGKSGGGRIAYFNYFIAEKAYLIDIILKSDAQNFTDNEISEIAEVISIIEGQK